MTFQHNKIKAILVYLELKTTRELVGKLEYKNKKYCFSYDKRYLEFKKALPIGPELPLTKLYFESEELFPSFIDRIPSKHNPAYADYCAEFSIDGVSLQLTKEFNHWISFVGDDHKTLKLEYLKQLYGLNKNHRFKSQDHEFEGVIVGVNDFGELEINMLGKKRTFKNKEISFLM